MEKEKNNNLEFWESVEKTDPKHTKQVSFGRKFTAIDPYYQNKNATEKFGMYGKSWGLKNIRHEFFDIGLDVKMVTLYANFFYYDTEEFEVTNSMKICGTNAKGTFVLDEDWAKKLETNTLSKALSRIGFNTDVFMGKFEDYTYVNEMTAEHTQITQDECRELTRLVSASKADLPKFNKTFGIAKLSEMKQSDYNKAIAMLNAKLAQSQRKEDGTQSQNDTAE